jgi:hypothetical protein
MPDNRYYYFKDAKGNRHTVNKAAFDNDREGFAKAFPGARMEVIDRKTGRRGDVDVKDAGRVGDFGAHLFTGQTVRREKYQPKTSLGKAAQRVAQKKWGGGDEAVGAKPNYASLGLTKPAGNKPYGASVGLSKPLGNGKESALVKGLREADALKRRDEEQMPIDYMKPSAVKQMVGRTRREQQTLDRRIEQAGREAGKDVMKPLREKEARLKTPVVDTGDANINAHVINTQEQAERQLAESGLEFANKHLDDYVSDNILNEFKTATAKGTAAESALSKASPFAYMAAGKAYNEALDPDKLLKHLQEKANADIAKVLSQPKMQEEIGLKAAAYGISPEEYVERSLIPGLQTKLAADFDKSELSRSMPKSTAEYILRGVNESMLGTIMSMGMTSKKQRQYAQQGMAMTDYGENPDVNPGMAARVARGTLGFVADAPVFGAAGKAGAAVAGKVFGNGVAQTARIANSTLGGRIARMAGSGMVSQGITGVLYGSTNAAVQNYSTGDDTSIGNTVKVMAKGGLSEGASWATMGGIGGAVGAGIYNVSGVKRIPAKAFQLAMEGIGMHIGGNVAKTIEGHDTDWTSIEGNLEACANVVALKLTHARLPKRQSKDGIKESYLDMVARNINSLMTSDGQRAAFGGYTFTNEEKEQLFGSASAPKRNESIYGYDAHNNPLTRKESLTSWAMRAKKTAAKGKGEESYKDTDAEFVKTAYDEIMADNTIPWDTKAKFSALVMGTVPSARPMMENCRIEGGSVNEYSKNGELLSKNSFKSIDERNSIIYSLNMKREDQRLSNAYGAAQIKDEKTAQATLEAVAEANGMTAEQLKAAMDKQPLRRSEEEQNACVALRKAYEDEQFVPGTLHAEQSNTEGKDVVEENGLGTETPNNEAASEVLGDLTKTEDALQAAMDGNDVLKEEYERMQKAGMSNPQIYMELFNSGLTQEQLAPLADYINALSKAQGMFKGTQDKIVETTQKHVGQWSYKGELNGEKQNGEQMVFVKDDKGRVLIVGAGDVAFDGEGRVRDGDMLTVYDPATREMDFVHAKDVTLERTTSSEEYAKDYQRQLEELNSTVYAEMQSGGEGGQPSLTEPAEPKEEEGNEASLSLSEPTKPLGEKETTPVGEKETIPVGEEPVATFADGTPVPMMKDSKGRETADYSQMSPEQGAEWMSSQFGENAEAAVDGQIKRAEKMLKEAEKIKVDYTGDLNDAKEAEAQKTMAVDAAKKELELYTNIKKAMTEKKVKAGMEKVSSVGGVGEVGSVGSVGVAREKFESGLRVVGNKRTRTLADGSKLRGHYEIVDADSLTPSHNANDGYKKSEGFPVNEEGRTINDRDYENDKQAQLVTDMIAMKYDGQAVDQVPVVTSDGIVVDGNGRTMAGQKAAKNGTDSAYLEALKENAENYGFTAEQIEQSGIKHPRLVLVSDEPMKYDTATFAKFNKNEKKAQGNTQQAVANSKKLSTDEISAIVSEIEGSGSLDAFFNNPTAINSLLKRLIDKGVIGLNEVAGLREGEDKLSAAGKDFVKNLLLGSVFSENTIRMMGADAMLKTKALNGIRAVTDNMKLGDYALMKEIDQAVQLLYEARQGGSGVDAYLRTPAMFGENAADRYDPISQAIALALEGKVEDFRELMMAYNRNAAPYADANQTEMFGERPTKEDFVNEFLKLRNWKDYETRHSSKEGNGDAGSSEGTEPQARGGSEPTEGEGLGSRGNTGQGENIDVRPAKKNSGTHDENTEGESGNVGLGSTDKGSRNNEGQREVDKAEEEREAASVRMQKADGYSEFADKHGLDDIWLARYAEAIKENNPGAANTALSNLKVLYLREHTAEKKALMEREGVHGLIANKRLFEPIRNAIKEQYGDVDILVEEHRKQVEQKTNMMEAARKKAEEEERKRQARLEELAELTDEDIDNRYADALAKGDEAAAREMLDEAARRKGYGDADSDYQGVGAWSAPSKPDYETDEARRNAVGEDSPDLNVEDMAAGYNNQPEDIFVHPNKYSQGLPTSEESGKAIQTAIDDIRNGKKDVKVKVYRAVPTSVKEGKLRNGDWVTPSKKYAEIHGDNRLDGKYRIIEDEVPVNELWWDGNDVNEWGYDNGKSYRYKNVKNNRKQNDLVTRDDKGNVIPPSKRFNQRKADERYQRGVGGVKPSKAEVALRDAVIDRLRESGMDVIADEAEGQRVLDEANGKVREMSFGEAYDYDAYPLGRVEPNLAEKEVAVVEADVNHGFANYKEAKAWAKQHVSKVYNNEESGGKGDVRISNAAIDKFMSQSAIDKSDSKDVHMAVLKVLPEVLKSSIDVETHPDFLKGEDGKRRAENGMNKDVLVHRCYGAVSIDGKPYRVKITLKEEVRNKKLPHNTHSYEATKIELLAGQHGDVTMTSPRNSNSSKQIEQRRNMVKPEGDNPNTNNSISAAKLLENVGMSYNSGEKVLDASKKRSEGVRFFRTANGEAYGFTVGGKIYIDPKIATSETPVHEYAHLWAEALRNGNPKEWQNVVELMKDTKVWDEVKARYPELKSDGEIADEVIATYSGRRGAERLRAEERKITESNSGVYEKIKTIGAFEKVKMSLDKFWKGVADFLHIRYTSAEEVADRVMKDLLDGVDPRGSEKGKGKSEKSNGNPRFQFIGEKGAAEADHAEEVSVRLDNLSVARDMEAEKKDAKTIKMATGWERGADGKWRYEIADMKEFDRNGNLLYRKHHPDYARYIELQDKELKNLFEDGEELTDKEREEYEALSKKYESDKFGGEKLDNIHTLEAYVDAPELFKAYPELRNVRMTFMDTGGDEIASYHHISSVFGVDKDNVGEIVVNTGKVSVNTRTNEVKSAVLHEMQHAIQDMEGFAMGGNTERMKSDFLEAKAEWAARAYAHELEETAKALGEDYDQLGVERALIKEYEDMDMSDELPDKDTRIKGFNYFARGYADRSLDDAIKRFRLNESTRGDFNPYIEYSRLAGEVEARNVQKRMDMSAEERRASLAAETEDVSREDQIFLTRNGVDKPHWASISLSKPRGGTENAKPLEGRIAETVEKVSKQTGGKVKMVNAVEEIGNEQVRRDIESGKNVTGWYDENTGEVHLYMPNIHDAYTAEKTVWHETVGHKGMRGLLGDKFNDYMRGLRLDLDNPVNAELRAYVKERMIKDAMGFYDAIEEFIAESAEKGKGEPGFWNYIKNKVTDALHEIGYRISPNVKDVKYMLWLAKNVQKKGNDPWWKMRADAVKWKIEHENVEYTEIHGGEFYENDGKNHDFEDMTKEEWDEATDGQIHYRTAPSAATALDRYHTMLNAHGYMATEAFMDNMLSLEKLMKAVDPSIKKIEDVKSSMNPYLMQNITEGQMSIKSELFRIRYMDPLSKAMSSVLDSFDGKKVEDRIRNFNLYMIRKHGLERNRVLFVRDKIREERKVKSEESDSIDALETAWKDERSDLRQKLDSGQIDLKEYYRQMDEWIVQNIDKDFKAEEHDYSGMHGLQGIDDMKSPYDDAGAIDEVMSQEASMEGMKKGSVADFWKKVKAATDYSVNSDYDNNIISKETHDGVLGMFNWYVPLRKFDEATAEDVYGYVTEMGDPSNYIGTTLMNAKGRKSLSNVEILAQIGLMGNRAIRNGGQNSIKLAFARFVRNSGEQNLVKETKVWVKKTGTDMNGNDIWEEAYPQIPEGADANTVAGIVNKFEADMKAKQAKGEAKTLSSGTDIGFKFQRAKDKSQHFVDVKIAGRTHRFVVLGNPRAAQALNGMLENGKASQKWLQTLTRWMAMASTSWSPEFVMRNIVKDVEFASAHVMAKEGGIYFAKWARYYGELSPINMFYNEGAGALKSMKWKDFKGSIGYGLYARYREGTLGNTKMERYFKEFMDNGGETGFVQLFSMHDMEKSYKGVVEKESANGVKKVAVNAIEVLKKVGENVESLNEVAENMARFATYCTSRDLGRSAARSAYDAKEVSTNFNRHGSGDAIKSFKNGEMSGWQKSRRNTYGFLSGYLRNYSMFFNAGIQSTNLLFKNFKNAPKGTATAMTAAPFALALIMAAVNNAYIQNEDEKDRGNVKDPYGELPDYIRRNNLCIYVGKNRFVTVPLAIELRAFYSLGDLAAGQTFAENVKSQRNMAMDAVGCMSQLFPVVDFLNNPNYEKSLKNGAGMTVEAISPTAIVPLIEWWLNNDWKGAPIRRTGDKAELNPAWQNAYSNVPARLVDLNKWANAYSNDVAPGNPEMKGSDALDFITDPSMLNHFYESLSGGMGTTVKRSVGLAAKVATGKTDEIEVGDVPFLRSLFYTPREQSSMARTKAKWYSYKESMEKNMSNYSMLKNKNVPLTERIRNAADRHRFEQGADYARIRIIKDAEKQMKRWNKMKRLNADDKKQVDFANKNIEMIMQKAVEQMDKVSNDQD